MTKITIHRDTALGFDDIQALIAGSEVEVDLDNLVIDDILRCRSYLDEKLNGLNEKIYGINTGFGNLADVIIPNEKLNLLQENLLLSHACGFGNVLPDDIVRIMILLKVKSLTKGVSGVRLELIERLLFLLNYNWIPEVFQKGSLGASGDLAPLAHLCLPLIGHGRLKKLGTNIWIPAMEVLDSLQMKPLSLAAKEGLALLNGTQFMGAYASWLVVQSTQLMNASVAITALSFEAFNCKIDALHPKIQECRGQFGQIEIASQLRRWLGGGICDTIHQSQTQDQYAFRCSPQVLGASLDTLQYVKQIVVREINGATDNPLIFMEENKIISGGNFHGQPLALVLDFLKIAMAEVGNISERRTYNLLSGKRELPEFLVAEPGLNSGLMIPQYTAAALVSQNKQFCSPASIDSITSSNGQEDHVSMGANAALACFELINNLWQIIGIEWFTAAQALHFRDVTSLAPHLKQVYIRYRTIVEPVIVDRYMKCDLDTTNAFIQSEAFALPSEF